MFSVKTLLSKVGEMTGVNEKLCADLDTLL